jgi:hypothetical protein
MFPEWSKTITPKGRLFKMSDKEMLDSERWGERTGKDVLKVIGKAKNLGLEGGSPESGFQAIKRLRKCGL